VEDFEGSRTTSASGAIAPHSNAKIATQQKNKSALNSHSQPNSSLYYRTKPGIEPAGLMRLGSVAMPMCSGGGLRELLRLAMPARREHRRRLRIQRRAAV